MKTKKNKILILTGLKHNVEAAVKSAVTISKIIDAEINLFYVKKPTEIVNNDSQLSALRSINQEQIQTEKELNTLLEPLKTKYNIEIKSKFSFGNIKSEIEDFINQMKPDLIVLGKRKSNLFNLTGDRIIEFILKKFSLPVLIASDTNSIESAENLSVGILNSKEDIDSKTVLNKLVQVSKTPLKSFKIVEKGEALNNINSNPSNTIEYVFEKNDNTIHSITNYLDKSNVNLLYLNRGKYNNQNSNSNKDVPLKKIINTVNVPLLIAN